jgi:carbonic anhydrase
MLEANVAWSQSFSAGGMPAAPSRQVAVVACMDARVLPLELLGITAGEAHVLRNAGGVVTEDTLRSLAVSQHALGTREVLLVHHTRCGMTGLDAAAFADRVEQATGTRPPWDARGFADVDDDVRESVRLVREAPYLLSTEVRGAVYDVDTGLLREVS